MSHTYQHAALLYDDPQDFAAATASFVGEGVDAGEAVVVVTSGANTEALRDVLGAAGDAVTWGAAEDWYLRPGVMFDRFQETITDLARTHKGRIRVIGEQVHEGRTAAEVRELLRYDSLSNVVFQPTAAWVLCPYRRATTPPEVLTDVLRSHPFLRDGGEVVTSDTFVVPEVALAHGNAHDDLPTPPPYATLVTPPMRAVDIRRLATAMGRGFLTDERTQDLVFSVNEALNNAETHGGGATGVTLWVDGARLTCEVRDAGPGLSHPFCGYLRPSTLTAGGRGLWLTRQLCDLVEVRSQAGRGTTVRLHVS